MKIKFSKVMAIVCAVSVAFAGLTAFAAIPGAVTTTTTYDAYNGADVNITVTSNVTGAEANKEVTYYVSKADGTIVYINQKTADGTGATNFEFQAKQGDVLAATAKFGTDATTNEFPTFKFADGINFLTEGDANVSALGVTTIEATDVDGVEGLENGTKCYKAIVNGKAGEYGIKANGVYYPAAGCSEIDGTYIVILKDINVSGDVYAYAKDFDGTVKHEVKFE